MTALMAKKLSRSFGEEVAVDDIDLEIHPGEIHAIVGLNGAGKTTLMRLMLGMLRPGTGQATILGSVAQQAPREVWRKVGHLIEAPCAYPELTIRRTSPPAPSSTRSPPAPWRTRSPPPSTTSSSVIG